MDFVVKVGVRDPQHVLEIFWSKKIAKISKIFDDFFFENFQNFQNFQKFQVREKSLVVLNGIVGCFKRNLF